MFRKERKETNNEGIELELGPFLINLVFSFFFFFFFVMLLCWTGPLLVYLFERLVRFARGHQDTILHRVIQHPSRVIELRMRKAHFRFDAAQYLFLNCPYIAPHEWHPFTIRWEVFTCSNNNNNN